MPELPEVETIVRNLRPELEKQVIVSAQVFWPRTLAQISVEQFETKIKNQQIQDVSRRAKFLDLRLTDFHLFIHLRMSGDLVVKVPPYLPEKHDRVIFTLADQRTLVFNDTRKFGRIWLTEDPETVIARLGPEPLEPAFTSITLYNGLKERRRQIKPLLLDQSFVAGLGNIYTDEALHLSGIHPLRFSDTISMDEAKQLHQAIQAVLNEGITSNGASFDWVYRGGTFQNHFRVYQRAGQPCFTCGALIQKIVIGQRGTHFCPNCQEK